MVSGQSAAGGCSDMAEDYVPSPLFGKGDLNSYLNRTQYCQPSEQVPVVCVLDTGINRGHPLLSHALAAEDLHSVEPGWGTDDIDGHGTEMAGLALFGDLGAALESAWPVVIDHRIESVKLLTLGGSNVVDSLHHGYLTGEAVARPEVIRCQLSWPVSDNYLGR